MWSSLKVMTHDNHVISNSLIEFSQTQIQMQTGDPRVFRFLRRSVDGTFDAVSERHHIRGKITEC